MTELALAAHPPAHSAELEALLKGFRWIAVPHGPSSSGKKLVAGLRVVPVVPVSNQQTLGEYCTHRLPGVEDALLDWPRYVAQGLTLTVAAYGAKLEQLGTVTLKVSDAWHDRRSRQGPYPAQASSLWRAIFLPALQVPYDPKTGAPGLMETLEQSSAPEPALVRSFPHERLASELEAIAADVQATSLVQQLEDRSLRRIAGVVPVGTGTTTALGALGALHSPLVPAVNALSKVLADGTDPVSRWLSDRFLPKQAPAMKGIAGGGRENRFRLSEAALDKLEKLVGRWKVDVRSPVAAYEEKQAPSVDEMVLHRMYAIASDPAPEPAPKPSFVGAVGSLTLHPWLLEALGLVFDVELDLGNAAKSVAYIAITHVRGAHAEVDVAPARVAVEPSTWLPKSQKDRYRNGCLDLTSDSERFTFAQLDVDSEVQKAMQLANVLATQAQAGVASSRELALASLKTGGLVLVSERATEIARQEIEADAAAAKSRGKLPDALFAEDLVVGFRPDVSSVEIAATGARCTRRWRSLVARTPARLLLRKGLDVTEWLRTIPHDEAIVARMSRAARPVENGRPVVVPQDELFTWSGWSLAVPPPETESSSDGREELGVVSVRYRGVPGLPAQRIGRGYRAGLRLVFPDGWSISTEQATAVYDGDEPKAVGSRKEAWAPFLRAEPVLPPDVHLAKELDERLPGERAGRILVTDGKHGTSRTSARYLVPPRIDLALAISLGMFDGPSGRRTPPTSAFPGVELKPHGSFPTVGETGPTIFRKCVLARRPDVPYLPDPWATRIIIGIYRDADDHLLEVHFHDYYDAEHRWPNCRPLRLEVRAGTSDSLPPGGMEVTWRDGMILTLAPGTAVKLRVWHELDARRLASSAVVDRLGRFLQRNDQTYCRNLIGIEDCCGDAPKVQRDQLVRCLSRWHERTPYDLRPLVRRGRPARDTALTSFWMLNPMRELEAAHAVRSPVGALRFSEAQPGRETGSLPKTADDLEQQFVVDRDPNQTTAKFGGDIVFHRASTTRVECFGSWNDWKDGRSEPRQARMFALQQVRGILPNPHAAGVVPEDNDLLALGTAPRKAVPGRKEGDGDVPPKHPLEFDFKDHRARLVTFRLETQSRYWSDFPEDGAEIRRSAETTSRWVPASRPPDAPAVAYVLPSLRWDHAVGKGTVRHRRHGGHFRIWLEGEWHSSGEGELLALVCWPDALFTPRPRLDDFLRKRPASVKLPAGREGTPEAALANVLTAWGRDPLLPAPTEDDRKSDRLQQLIPAAAFKNRIADAFAKVRLPGIAKDVALALYPVKREGNGRWHADLEIDPGEAYSPFLRLGLARYQPNAVKGCELSDIVTSEFVQLLPHRAASVVVDRRPDGRCCVRLTVAGTSPFDAANKAPWTSLYVRLDEVDRSGHGEWTHDAYVKALSRPAAWVPQRGDAGELAVASYSEHDQRWTAEISVKADPGKRYSLYLEEHETIHVDANPDEPLVLYDKNAAPLDRVVYCDRLLLDIER